MLYRGLRIALAIPCLNEGRTVHDVVQGFCKSLPELDIFVFDNASTDNTAEEARRAGARVVPVRKRGKGYVVTRIFADIDADVLLIVDGDGTYDPSAARRMVDTLLDERLDMVVAARELGQGATDGAFRPGHKFGNRLLTGTVMRIFGGQFEDMLSGYRAFSRRYIKSFPGLSRGFEIETELTIHALALNLPYAEIEAPYGARPEGSESKLSTWRDGIRILYTITRIFIIERPKTFYTITAALTALISIILAIPIFIEFLDTGLVPRLPTAVLCAALGIMALLLLASGLIIDAIRHSRREMRRLIYLNVGEPLAAPAPNADRTA